MKEYDEGMIHVKSALQNFAKKYVIDGKPEVKPFNFLQKNLHCC